MTQMLMSSLLGLELAIFASGPPPSMQSPWLVVLFVLTAVLALRAAMKDEGSTKEEQEQQSPPAPRRESRPRGAVRSISGPRDRRA